MLRYLDVVYRYLFNRSYDGLERSTEHADEYMIIDNDPVLTRSIDVPKDMASLSCMALVAGVLEAVMDGHAFVRRCLGGERLTSAAGSRHRPLCTDRCASEENSPAHQARPVRRYRRRHSLRSSVMAREESLGPVK